MMQNLLLEAGMVTMGWMSASVRAVLERDELGVLVAEADDVGSLIHDAPA
jgi:hypothetical protein